MNRIEAVRAEVNNLIEKNSDPELKRIAYVHLYGVAQACAIIAAKRDLEIELAVIAGMMHDIYAYTSGERINHAERGAAICRRIMSDMRIFSCDEIKTVFSAVYHHSDKSAVHTPFDEMLKDADVIQHCYYDPMCSPVPHERDRYIKLVNEFGLRDITRKDI